jgi:hypothetical protein
MRTVDLFQVSIISVISLQEELSTQKGNLQRNLVLDENTGINYMLNVTLVVPNR